MDRCSVIKALYVLVVPQVHSSVTYFLLNVFCFVFLNIDPLAIFLTFCPSLGVVWKAIVNQMQFWKDI